MIELPVKVDESEEWKDVVGYEGLYMISNFGRVFSVRSGIVLKQQIHTTGCMVVNFYRDGRRRVFRIHRLVSTAFCEGHFEGAVVDHVDGNRKNNHCSNLEWVTTRENTVRGRLCQKNKNRTSRFDGVYRTAQYGRYVAQIHHGGKCHHLVASDTETECANIYNEALEAINNGTFSTFIESLAIKRRSGYSSSFIGVNWDKQCNKWISEVYENGRNRKLLRSNDEELCARLYQEAKQAISEDRFEDFMSDLAEAKASGVFKDE